MLHASASKGVGEGAILEGEGGQKAVRSELPRRASLGETAGALSLWPTWETDELEGVCVCVCAQNKVLEVCWQHTKETLRAGPTQATAPRMFSAPSSCH